MNFSHVTMAWMVATAAIGPQAIAEPTASEASMDSNWSDMQFQCNYVDGQSVPWLVLLWKGESDDEREAITARLKNAGFSPQPKIETVSFSAKDRESTQVMEVGLVLHGDGVLEKVKAEGAAVSGEKPPSINPSHDFSDLDFYDSRDENQQKAYIIYFGNRTEAERDALAKRLKAENIPIKIHKTRSYRSTINECITHESESGFAIHGKVAMAKIKRLGAKIKKI